MQMVIKNSGESLCFAAVPHCADGAFMCNQRRKAKLLSAISKASSETQYNLISIPIMGLFFFPMKNNWELASKKKEKLYWLLAGACHTKEHQHTQIHRGHTTSSVLFIYFRTALSGTLGWTWQRLTLLNATCTRRHQHLAYINNGADVFKCQSKNKNKWKSDACLKALK